MSDMAVSNAAKLERHSYSSVYSTLAEPVKATLVAEVGLAGLKEAGTKEN